MNVDSIKNGIVIDHITAGKAMELYYLLGLDKTDYHVAIITNANSKKMGKKDIIKVDGNIKLDMDAIGYFDPGATVTIIEKSEVVEKKKITLPERITNVILCKNPRCITTTEQELPHVFRLTDEKNRIYRCLYCEAKAERK
ncbi:MAG: aspartate carbamoyltransferase regulatory subunit [Clostridia bacterium]|nr:aspartate carbamoyltransferase regulatory subunit [Clostridia bacterium]